MASVLRIGKSQVKYNTRGIPPPSMISISVYGDKKYSTLPRHRRPPLRLGLRVPLPLEPPKQHIYEFYGRTGNGTAFPSGEESKAPESALVKGETAPVPSHRPVAETAVDSPSRFIPEQESIGDLFNQVKELRSTVSELCDGYNALNRETRILEDWLQNETRNIKDLEATLANIERPQDRPQDASHKEMLKKHEKLYDFVKDVQERESRRSNLLSGSIENLNAGLAELRAKLLEVEDRNKREHDLVTIVNGLAERVHMLEESDAAKRFTDATKTESELERLDSRLDDMHLMLSGALRRIRHLETGKDSDMATGNLPSKGITESERPKETIGENGAQNIKKQIQDELGFITEANLMLEAMVAEEMLAAKPASHGEFVDSKLLEDIGDGVRLIFRTVDTIEDLLDRAYPEVQSNITENQQATPLDPGAATENVTVESSEPKNDTSSAGASQTRSEYPGLAALESMLEAIRQGIAPSEQSQAQSEPPRTAEETSPSYDLTNLGLELKDVNFKLEEIKDILKEDPHEYVVSEIANRTDEVINSISEQTSESLKSLETRLDALAESVNTRLGGLEEGLAGRVSDHLWEKSREQAESSCDHHDEAYDSEPEVRVVSLDENDKQAIRGAVEGAVRQVVEETDLKTGQKLAPLEVKLVFMEKLLKGMNSLFRD
ncbi:hypothetical protein ABW19_dt0205136 [Dactylella cylindrospora]|nr:hypothetical protein ABW19_dt0205136 [Dactylella cylindrospora]